MNQRYTLQQEFKWRELEEQRKAERLHKRLQQEQAYLLSLQHESKQQPGDKTKLPSDHRKPSQTSTLPPDRAPAATPQAQVLEPGACESSRAPQTIPSDKKSQAAVQGKTDETSPSHISQSPTSHPPMTETPTDSKPPQAECLSDRPTEAFSHPPQPIREVNLLLGSVYPPACSFQLPLACLHTPLSGHDVRAGACNQWCSSHQTTVYPFLGLRTIRKN